MNEFLYNILAGINGWVGSWGVAMIIFTVMIRLALTPLDMKSRVSMRKTTKLQPQIQALQKKYANDKEKLNAKTAELYKKEHINPLSSCLPLLLTWPILIVVFNAMRMASNRELLEQVGRLLNGEDIKMEQFLWVKNLWMPDNIFKAAFPDSSTLKAIPTDQWVRWFNNLKTTDAFAGLPAEIQALTDTHFDKNNLSATVDTIMQFINTPGSDYARAFESTGYSLVLFGTIPKMFNGWLLLPILSAVSQIVMTKITTGKQAQQPAVSGQPNTGKFMQWFFPIFSLWICLSATAAFALYWVSGNLVSMAQTVIINRILDKREQSAAAVAGEGSVK